MSVYEKNIRFLEKHQPNLAAALQSIPDRRCKTETARNGSKTLLYNYNGTPYYLHSKFNPQRESEKLTAQKDLSADHIVVLGLGLGYHLEHILENKHRLSRVLLIEPDLEIVKHSLHTFRWHKWVNRHDFFYALGENVLQVTSVIHTFLNIITFDKLEYIELPSETRILQGFFKRSMQVVDEEVRSNLYDFKTRLGESYMLPRNILKNLPLILKSRATAALKNMFQGTPGFIVSAGPSLDKNLLHLKKLGNRGIIIAVDTALKPLLKRGIQPNFTCIGDPSHKNYLHLQGEAGRLEHYIAAEAGIAHRVFREFREKIFTLSVGKPITRLIEANSEPLGELEAWGSVISIALTLGVYIGLDPIVFVGQDFAFTDTRNHCRGTSWEENKMEYTRDLDQLQRFEKQSIAGNRKVTETRDIFGKKTFTSERLELYKTYLSRLTGQYTGTRFINATEGGIFSEIPSMPLYEVIKKHIHGKQPLDLERLDKLPTLDKEENLRRLRGFFNAKEFFFRDYKSQIAKILKTLRGLSDLSQESALPVLEEAESVKEYLYALSQNGEIVEMWSLTPIYHFLKQYRRIEVIPMGEKYIKESRKLYIDYFENIQPLITDIVKTFKKTLRELQEL